MSKARKTAGRITFVSGRRTGGSGTADRTRRRGAAGRAGGRPGSGRYRRRCQGVRGRWPRTSMCAGGRRAGGCGEGAGHRGQGGRNVVRLVVGDPLTTDAVVREALAVGRTAVGLRRGARVPATTACPRTPACRWGTVHQRRTCATRWTGPRWPRRRSRSCCRRRPPTWARSRRRWRARVPANTPVAATARARPDPAERAATLAEVERAASELPGPLVVTVGAAVSQAGKLGWWSPRAVRLEVLVRVPRSRRAR